MHTARISQVKAKLLVEHPYFGTLASRLELRESENIQAFLSDGVVFQYNRDYLGALSDAELGFALSNGALHAALSHENRRNDRMGWLWQLATDYAINAMLVENGMTPPPHIHYDTRFDGMYAEAIYAVLKNEIQNEEYDDDASNDTGFNEANRRHQQQIHNPDYQEAKDRNRPQMEVDTVTKEQQWHQQMHKALQQALEGDSLPQGMERFVDLKAIGTLHWRELLHHAVERHFRSDYRQIPPSKKLLYRGIYLPSLHSELLRLVIAVDSSGSVDTALLERFIAEIESLMMVYPQHEIELLVCDSSIRSHETFYGGEMLNVTLLGGGATDFRPVFEWISKELFTCNLLLYFTDTHGTFPEHSPDIETFWITPERADVPFGTVIVLE